MLESMWKKSNCGERDSASAMARCGASKIEMSWIDADADAGERLEFLHRRRHRHIVVRPDHALDVGRAERLGRGDDAVVLGSGKAWGNWTSGNRPVGAKFAIVSPMPASMKRRLDSGVPPMTLLPWLRSPEDFILAWPVRFLAQAGLVVRFSDALILSCRAGADASVRSSRMLSIWRTAGSSRDADNGRAFPQKWTSGFAIRTCFATGRLRTVQPSSVAIIAAP